MTVPRINMFSFSFPGRGGTSLAYLFRKTGDLSSALQHVDSALQHCYHDRILQEKRAIENALTQHGLYHTIPDPFKVL